MCMDGYTTKTTQITDSGLGDSEFDSGLSKILTFTQNS